MSASFRSSPASEHRLADQTRERFVNALEGGIADLVIQVQDLLSGLVNGGARNVSLTELTAILETARSFQSERHHWAEVVRKAWREPVPPARADMGSSGKLTGLALEDSSVIERKILASRLSNAVSEAAGSEINNLKLRIQHLEGTSDWAAEDPLRPETLPAGLIKAWLDCGLTQPMWNLALPAIQSALSQRMAEAYRAANQYLIDNDVMAEIDLRALVKRDRQGNQHGGGKAASGPTPQAGIPPHARSHGQASMSRDPATTQPHGRAIPSRLDEHTRQGAATGMPYVRQTALGRADQETRMLTSVTPMARMRERAQGVLGQLRRMLTQRVAGFDPSATPAPPSPSLARALANQVTAFEMTELMPPRSSAPDIGALSGTQVQAVAAQLRQRATELKTKADKPSEKAIIEIVALMFQAILAEEHIPSSIRVWFARLQIPVLRLALAEPDFFASLQHPARQLIDRMGTCALGFDATQISGSRLEREIKRIVQVIEQYPETGRRVYQLVLDEFKKFLGRSLTEGAHVQQAATLAQKVEQKEALSIQYTIELRRMLEPVPVGDEVREFLFRIWSDVLAMSAVRHGPQHAETLRFKQAAVDLLWLVSPRSDRAARTSVLQKLPGVIAVLREGMTTLAITDSEQNGHIKLLNDAVMQAFVSRAEAISQSTLDELARGLAGLEDVVTDDPQGDMLLDPDMIEQMFGVSGDALEVIADGGSRPGEGMRRWASELELGAWFSLDYRNALTQVQYVWRSARGQLHLLANNAGKSYLVQTRRLASYLQAGLLAPVEDEALTVRATRQALTRLNAAPNQLLH
jgi:hypothetical protein